MAIGRVPFWRPSPRRPSARPESGDAGDVERNAKRNVWAEVALVAVAGMIELGATSRIAQDNPDHPGSLGVAGAVLLGLGILALPWRHRHPTGVMAFVFTTTLTYVSLGYAPGPIWLAMIVAFAQVVLVGRRRTAIIFLIAGYLAFPWLGYLIGRTERPSVVLLAALAAWLVALISVAEAVRYRREQAAEARRWEAEALRRRATDERLRIARELHDVVAHNMSLISIQAGVALHLLDANTDQARSSLAAIKDASKEALVELRSILGVLRVVDDEPSEASAAPGSGSEGPEEAAPRSPVPSLRRLDDLVARARAAGVDVDVRIGPNLGDLGALPRQVDLAAFRIVQESLTNVARHSDDRAATVRLDARDGGLAVAILDEGSASPVHPSPSADLPTGGNGIAGMRERAASVGGRLEAGPRPGRGFAVRAWLPLGPAVGGPARDDAGVVGASEASPGGGAEAGGSDSAEGADPADPALDAEVVAGTDEASARKLSR